MLKKLSYDLSQPYEEVNKWLTQCAENDVFPWKCDLKQEIYSLKSEMYHENSYVKKLLVSWIGTYSAIKETEDCDLMQCIYQVLWGLTSKNAYGSAHNENIDADVMTSFWLPYKAVLNVKKLKNYQGKAYTKNTDNLKELIERFDDDVYQEINIQFEKFAMLTHTIGNMTLTPKKFNRYGHNDSETWRKNLNYNFQLFLDKYHQNYDWKILNVNNFNEYKSVFLYQYNQMDMIYTQLSMNNNDINTFTKEIPNEIESRGKHMVEILLDKLTEKGFDVINQRKLFFQK